MAQVTLAPAHNSTPGNPSLCTPSLALTRKEYEELVAAYNMYMLYLNAQLTDEEVIDYLFEVTAGQVRGSPAPQEPVCQEVCFMVFKAVLLW